MEEKKIYFTCETNIDWDTYKEIEKIKYRKFKVIFMSFSLPFVLIAALGFYTKTLSFMICFAFFFIVYLGLMAKYVMNKRSIKLHGQQKVKYGKDVINTRVEFGDKIYVYSSTDLDRSYEYALIENAYETKDNIILSMTHEVMIVLPKANIKTNDSTDFYQFIFDKCYSLKKAKFKKLKDEKKKFNRVILLYFFLSVVVLMLYFFQITPENWRELGRNPQFSSSQQSTNSSSDTLK